MNSVTPVHRSIYFLFVFLFSECIFSFFFPIFHASSPLPHHISLILYFLNLSLINQSLAKIPYHFFLLLLLLLRNPSPFPSRSPPKETQRERERERMCMGFGFWICGSCLSSSHFLANPHVNFVLVG